MKMETCSSKPTSRFTATIVSLPILLLLLSIPTPSIAAQKFCHPDEENALLKIKAAINSPDPLFAIWQPNTDCCSWDGVLCDFQTNIGRVITLLIVNVTGGVEPGYISPAIGDLLYLQNLYITYSDVVGTIPSTITKLKNLNFLALRSNRLSGPIPEFLNQLQEVTTIDLSYNKLSGMLPQTLSTLSKLLTLSLAHNQLTGPIPESWGKLLGATASYDLSHNFLNGTLPVSLGDLNYNFIIDLSRNSFAGDASFLFGKNKLLNSIYLSSNKFEFDFSNVELPSNLKDLLIDHNRIYGSLPEGLTEISLNTFDVSYNELCGPIPQGGNLQSFNSAAFDHNKCLCGSPLPACKTTAS